jgi:hypothetical protein
MNMNTLTRTIQGYYMPYGVLMPVQMYAWLAMRHSHLYGVGPTRRPPPGRPGLPQARPAQSQGAVDLREAAGP